MGIISNWEPEVVGAKLQQHLITKDEVGTVTMKDTGAKDFQNSMNCKDLWCLLLDYSISEKK